MREVELYRAILGLTRLGRWSTWISMCKGSR